MAYLTADELLDTEDGFTEWNEDAAADRRRKRWNRPLRKNAWQSWKASWSRTSIPLIMMPSWRPRRKKRPRSAISG